MLTYEDYKEHGVKRTITSSHKIKNTPQGLGVLNGIMKGVMARMEQGDEIKVETAHSVYAIPEDELKKIDKLNEFDADSIMDGPHMIRDREDTKHIITITIP